MFLLKVILYTALFIELMTIVNRFVFRVSSKEIYVKLMRKFKLKKFYHFHHLFLGILIALMFYFLESNFLFNFGIGVITSDLIHHFIVLWIMMGNPEFHVVYKDVGLFKKEEIIEKRKIERVMNHLIKEVESLNFYPPILASIPKARKMPKLRRAKGKRGRRRKKF